MAIRPARLSAAAVILAAISAGVFVCRRQAPYLLVGWLWYLGMLVPVIGLLQVGGQSMADRYTYLPQIGLVLGLVWAVTDSDRFLAARAGTAVRRAGRFLLALAAAGIIAALAVAAWRQTGYWRDSETLWVRDMMYPNLVGHLQFRLALAADHRHEEAIHRENRPRRPARPRARPRSGRRWRIPRPRWSDAARSVLRRFFPRSRPAASSDAIPLVLLLARSNSVFERSGYRFA